MTMLRNIILAAIALLCFAADPAAAQSSTGGDNGFHLIAANSNNSTLIAAGEHVVHGVQVSGVGAAPAYLKLYDKATAPTCGTDTPLKVLAITAASTAALGAAEDYHLITQFRAGLGICVVTGIADNDNTSVAAATFNINIDWK